MRSALDHLGAFGVTSVLLEGGRTWPARSSTPARSTRCGSSWPPSRGRLTARDPLEGEGAERIAEATRAVSLDVERIGSDVLISARLKEW